MGPLKKDGGFDRRKSGGKELGAAADVAVVTGKAAILAGFGVYKSVGFIAKILYKLHIWEKDYQQKHGDVLNNTYGYIFSIIFPPIAVIWARKSLWVILLNVALSILAIPGMIHAFFIVKKRYAEFAQIESNEFGEIMFRPSRGIGGYILAIILPPIAVIWARKSLWVILKNIFLSMPFCFILPGMIHALVIVSKRYSELEQIESTGDKQPDVLETSTHITESTEPMEETETSETDKIQS